MEENGKTVFICLLICLGFFILVEVITTTQSNVKAATIDVGPGQTYTTIQEGIDAANPGDTVYVHASIYFESVIVNKTINLTGENKETTIIDRMGGSWCVLIKADYVNMSGFTLRNADYGILIGPSNHSKIARNIISNISMFGYGIIDAGANNIICENLFYNAYGGIWYDSNSNNCTAYNNFINDSYGGFLIDGNNITLLNNEICNTTWGGIYIVSSNNTLINNNIYNIGTLGIDIANLDTYNNTLVNNTIDNAEYGIRIWLRSKNNTFYNCSINNSRFAGLILSEGSQNSSFINCSILNSDIYDVSISESNTTFLNTTFDKTKVRFWDNSSTLKIQWFMHVFVRDIGDNVISNATVKVYNISDDLVASGKTDDEGFLRWIVVTERIQNYSTNISFTPHNVSAVKNSYVGYAIPEPIMDSSKQVNITLPIPQPLHHIRIVPSGPVTYYINKATTYTAIGWNDAKETQLNITWTPVWSIDNTSIATIDSSTGFFTTIAIGSSVVNVTCTEPLGIYAMSSFNIEPWPLHHIIISPGGLEYYYIGDAQTYTAIGWNNANETQQNMTWTPVWSIEDSSTATINSVTGGFIANALGSGVVKVTSDGLTGVYNISEFIIEPWPLNHIVITPNGPEEYYISNIWTYTAIGWNDAAETQLNDTWTPIWDVDDSTIATIDPDTGLFNATNLGSSNVRCRSSSQPQISNISSFSVVPWPLQHIEITPSGSENYYIGDTKTYTAVGWNNAEKTQINISWIPLWSVENTSIASINDTGYFTATALGSSVVNITCASQPGIYTTSSFTVEPWPLHHISILPTGPETYHIGDIIIYTTIGWNDVEETQINTTWTPVWNLVGNIEELTWEGEEARFEAKKSGSGSLKCYDDLTGIEAHSDIIVEKKSEKEVSLWLWILIVVILIVISLFIFLMFRRKKIQEKNENEK